MNSIKLYDNFNFCNIKFTKYHHTDCQKGSPYNYIAYMKTGNAKIISDSKTIYVNEGDIFFIPKGLPYQSYWYGNDDIDFLSFGFSELATSVKTKYMLQVIATDNILKEKLFNIPTNECNVDCKALSLFYDAMDCATRHMERDAKSSEDAVTAKVKQCIQNNPNMQISEIARLCNVSQPHLYSSFKKATNSTPNDYKQSVQCRIAIELLTTTDKSIEEISDMANFSSSSYFRKILKKHTGYTPKQIRKNGAF